MQHRMKEHPLSSTEIHALLARAQVASIGTTNADGHPYVVPVHFAALDGKLYFHGLPQGQKLENILRDARVCLEVHEMGELLYEGVEMACDTNTAFESVIVLGEARILEDAAAKERALDAIVAKYTPHFVGRKLPEKMIAGTAVVEITPGEITGKYYRG